MSMPYGRQIAGMGVLWVPGLVVGAAVGLADGLTVGTAVGGMVGMAVGAMVGRALGAMVGQPISVDGGLQQYAPAFPAPQPCHPRPLPQPLRAFDIQ